MSDRSRSRNAKFREKWGKLNGSTRFRTPHMQQLLGSELGGLMAPP